MSLKSKFIALLTVAGATVAFSAVGMAQDKTVTTQTDKTEKQDKADHQRGHGRFGKEGRGERRGGAGMRMGGGRAMMFRGLNLTDAQKTQIQEIMKSNRPNLNTENREEMRSLMMARRTGTLTTAQEDKMKSMRTSGEAKAQSIHQQILGVLTPEQKAQMEQGKTQMKERMQQMKERMQQRRPMREQKAPPTPPKTN